MHVLLFWQSLPKVLLQTSELPDPRLTGSTGIHPLWPHPGGTRTSWHECFGFFQEITSQCCHIILWLISLLLIVLATCRFEIRVGLLSFGGKRMQAELTLNVGGKWQKHSSWRPLFKGGRTVHYTYVFWNLRGLLVMASSFWQHVLVRKPKGSMDR